MQLIDNAIYNLKLGFPNIDIIPHQTLAQLAAQTAHQADDLQYGVSFAGPLETLHHVARFLEDQLCAPVSPDRLAITNGSMQGIDIVCRAYCQPGDIVAVESPTFFQAISIFRLSGVTVVGVPMQPDGIDADALEELAHRYGMRLRMLYTIPSYHNPTGSCMGIAKRQRVINLARKHNILILEDTAYQFIHFDMPVTPLIKQFDDEDGHVIAIGSFSKLIAPALRQGWIYALPVQIEHMMHFKADISDSLLNSGILTRYLREGYLTEQVSAVRAFYAHRCAITVAALSHYLPDDVIWTAPHGGFFIWLELPTGFSASEVSKVAEQQGLSFLVGLSCFPDPKAVEDRFVRLTFAYIDENKIDQAVQILARCLEIVLTKG